MNCREFMDLIIEFCEKTLAAEKRAEFEEHLNSCHVCETYFTSYKCTIRLGKAACESERCSEVSVPESLVQRIVQARKNGNHEA